MHLLLLMSLACITLVTTPKVIEWYQWRMCVQRLREFREQDYIQYGYEEFQVAVRPIFDRMLDEAIRLPATPGQKERRAFLKKYTIELARFSYESDLPIETVEFEEVGSIVTKIASRMDFDLNVDVYSRWRDFYDEPDKLEIGK